MRRYAKRDSIARDLVTLYKSFTRTTKRMSFARLCNWLKKTHNDEKDWRQYMINMIDDIYKEYYKIGEKKFLKKYGKRKERTKSKK